MASVLVVALVAQRQAAARELRQTNEMGKAHRYVSSAKLYAAIGSMSSQRRPARVRLEGNPTLVVGDSMTYEWPWSADQLGFWGRTTPEIREQFEKYIQDLQYETIILWPGTAHFHAGEDAPTYVADVESMVNLATLHASNVLLISPLLGNTTAEVAGDGFYTVRDEMPWLTTIDALAWRAEIDARRQWGQLTCDGLHLNEKGIARFASHLQRFGVDRAVSKPATPPDMNVIWLAQVW